MKNEPQSDLEWTLLFQIKALQLPAPICNHRFHETRRWRLDFAWPDRQLAVEVDGGTHSYGRHVRGSGYAKDCEKLNAAALNGYRVLRFTGKMVHNGTAVNTIEQAISLPSKPEKETPSCQTPTGVTNSTTASRPKTQNM